MARGLGRPRALVLKRSWLEGSGPPAPGRAVGCCRMILRCADGLGRCTSARQVAAALRRGAHRGAVGRASAGTGGDGKLPASSSGYRDAGGRDGRSMARECGLSHTTIWRWGAFGATPLRDQAVRSADPRHRWALADRALVLCVDEKSRDRTQPVLPMLPGMPERRDLAVRSPRNRQVLQAPPGPEFLETEIPSWTSTSHGQLRNTAAVPG